MIVRKKLRPHRRPAAPPESQLAAGIKRYLFVILHAMQSTNQSIVHSINNAGTTKLTIKKTRSKHSIMLLLLPQHVLGNY